MSSPAHSEAAQRSWTSPKLLAAVAVCCIALSLLLYGRTLSYRFVSSDDLTYVVRNPLTTRLDPEHLRRMLSEFYFTDYLPTLQVFLAVERAFFEVDRDLRGSVQPAESAFDASSYHLVSVLLHALNGVLLFLLLRRVMGESQPKLWAAGVAVALFLAHPLQVETVAWIAQQKSLLATALMLASLLCYARFREGGIGARAWYVAAMLLGAAALFAKSSAVALPALIVLYDWTVARRRLARSVLAALPLVLAALLACATTLLSQARSGAISGEPSAPAPVMFLTMLPVFAAYLRMILLPGGLAYFYYVPWRETLAAPAVLSGLAVLALFLYGLYASARQARLAFFWAAWFLAALLPVLNLVPLNTLMADRYLYLPMAGVAGLVALGLGSLERLGSGAVRWPARAGILAAVALLAILTARQVQHWRSDRAMWTRALTYAPQRPKPWYNVGRAYGELATKVEPEQPSLAADLRAKAIRAYQESLRRFGEDPAVVSALGAVHWELGNRQEALRYARRAVELEPDSALSLANLGNMLIELGHPEEGAEALQRALRHAPGSKELRGREAQLHLRLAGTYRQLGRIELARTHALQAASLAADRAAREAAEALLKKLGPESAPPSEPRTQDQR